MLNRVTVTGADDSVKPWDLHELQCDYPWVEWGILLGTRTEAPRFPSAQWCAGLVTKAKERLINISIHLCGAPVRAVCEKGQSAREVVEYLRPGLFDACQRIQLNFHGRYHQMGPGFLSQPPDGKQYILQDDGENDEIIDRMVADKWRSFVPLFDLSGGAGVLPDEGWPAPRAPYQGYAGGLSPENVATELVKIQEAVKVEALHTDYWIDVETRVRSDDDLVFDLKKVRAFLASTAPFVGK